MVRRSASRRANVVRIVNNAAFNINDPDVAAVAAVVPEPPRPQLALTAEHSRQIAATIDHGLSEDTRKNYRSRLARMISWFHAFYPNFCDVAVRPITDEERASDRKHFYDSREDFLYNRIDPQFILAFLSSQKQKEQNDGTFKAMSFINVRKYHDAILFGALEQETDLPNDYHLTVPSWLDAFKKETNLAQQAGLMEQHDADVMSFAMYRQIST